MVRQDIGIARMEKPARPLTKEDFERDFPGTEVRCMTLAEFESHDRHIEYWDGDARLVVEVREPTSGAHETPVQGLAVLAGLIAALRGAPIRAFGHVSLVIRDVSGIKRRALEADQTVYLHPRTAHMPLAGVLTVGQHDYPDVLLEVDHTTDARRRKLGLYEAWGFPEVWIDVPDIRSPRRSRDRRPGLSIHVLRGGAYRQVSASRAFPGWEAASIHRALNEPERSPETVADLTRVAAALGARGGTGPEDDLLLREQWRHGYEAGEREGWARVIEMMLAERGIDAPPTLGEELAQHAGLDRAAIFRAAQACRDSDDLRARLERLSGTG